LSPVMSYMYDCVMYVGEGRASQWRRNDVRQTDRQTDTQTRTHAHILTHQQICVSQHSGPYGRGSVQLLDGTFHRHTHITILQLSGLCPGQPGCMSRYQKVHFTIFWIFWSKMKITRADIWMDCHPIQNNWCPTSAIPLFLRRMPFLTQPSKFILAWDRHQICWLAYFSCGSCASRTYDDGKIKLGVQRRCSLLCVNYCVLSRGEEYCDEHVCLFVCLSACLRVYLTINTSELHRISTEFSVHVSYGSGSISLWQSCNNMYAKIRQVLRVRGTGAQSAI